MTIVVPYESWTVFALIFVWGSYIMVTRDEDQPEWKVFCFWEAIFGSIFFMIVTLSEQVHALGLGFAFVLGVVLFVIGGLIGGLAGICGGSVGRQVQTTTQSGTGNKPEHPAKMVKVCAYCGDDWIPGNSGGCEGCGSHKPPIWRNVN